MDQKHFSELLKKATELHDHKKLIYQHTIGIDVMIDEIGGEDLSKTVYAHITLASKIIGVPLLCYLEFDDRVNQCFMVFRNLKTNSLIDRNIWHLPQRLKKRTYRFYVLWVDNADRKEFDPELSFPVVLANKNNLVSEREQF